jgi:hypothetical protein
MKKSRQKPQGADLRSNIQNKHSLFLASGKKLPAPAFASSPPRPDNHPTTFTRNKKETPISCKSIW